ncbi:MAG TPA: hypothetical protein VN944_04080 [Nitrospiria bacterium]|nr:hypothetical protein [Nitrospiria bacterium]
MGNKQAPSSLEEPPLVSPSIAPNGETASLLKISDTIQSALIREEVPVSFRISPRPFYLAPAEQNTLEKLGSILHLFYKSQNKLYFESVRGQKPAWIAEYLDQGKPQQIVETGRMNRFKSGLPGIIRPDLILTPEGMTITELDSVPGGFGLTGLLNETYENAGYPIVGGSAGMTRGFGDMILDIVSRKGPPAGKINLGIVVSEESEDYLPEMRSFAKRFTGQELSVTVLRPQELQFNEEEVFGKTGNGPVPLHAIYRFFELFDYRNIPKNDLIFYAARKGNVLITPPPKAFLEEKLWFALFHHPGLRSFWETDLGEENFNFLSPMIPSTWILDPRELPPYGIIPGLQFRGNAVSSWKEIYTAGQKERRYVIKPSGYSELAWGARGVKIGHDMPETEWKTALEEGIQSFSKTPFIIQEFHQGRKVEAIYRNNGEDRLSGMTGRVRLCPYYFASDRQVRLGGVLATVCPADKKIIHGMSDAIMAPCAPAPVNPQGGVSS